MKVEQVQILRWLTRSYFRRCTDSGLEVFECPEVNRLEGTARAAVQQGASAQVGPAGGREGRAVATLTRTTSRAWTARRQTCRSSAPNRRSKPMPQAARPSLGQVLQCPPNRFSCRGSGRRLLRSHEVGWLSKGIRPAGDADKYEGLQSQLR